MVAVGQKAVMSNANEAFWQDMQEKPSNKFQSVKTHHAVVSIPFVILVPEGDLSVLHFDQSPVRDGYPVGVSGQILQDL